MKLFALLLTALTLALISCDSGQDGDSAASIPVVFGECKKSLESYNAAATEPVDTSRECVIVNYDADTGIMKIEHRNAVFNCCVADLTAHASIDAGTITITESEIFENDAACNCLCPYDISYEIAGVDPWEYTVNINNTIQFEINLSAQATGTFCYERSGYPWTE